MVENNTPTSPVLKGREGLTIPVEKDRMLEIKWADYWNKNGGEWGVQVHSTYTAEVVDGFYQFKADNPDIPDWWFPRDFMDGQQLTQRAFVGWGVTQEDIDNLKEGFEKGIFDKEKDKKLLKVVNDLDGSDKLIKSIDTPTNVVDDFDKPIVEEIETKNNIPKGSISKMGLALDPIAEGLEFALKGIGLGSVASWWVKAEAANFLAGLIRGAGAASGVAQLGQSQALMGEEFTADANAIKNAFAQNLGNQMKLSPSLWLENKYAQSSLGKGKTPTEQGYNWAKDALGFGK